ncbi:MAG: hypothetical protein CL503_03020 [Actinobacteria bacterium]|nr:hypothetical protein [Actinomycetota bacterium]|tara:strand:+ start:604 stop:1377 length:774 start_codon:yes stop_codon:yes gene_type:complete
MNFEYNQFESNSGSSDSISRYLGGSLSTADTGIGFGENAFSDILQTQMMAVQPINSKVDAILQRLENDQPLVGMTPQEASEAIFESIKHILSGVADVLKSMGQSGLAGDTTIEDLSRLIEGAKRLFDRSEDPHVLEQIGEVWEPLRKKKSPVFHSVHAYFFHIAVTFSDQDGEGLSIDTSGLTEDAEEMDRGVYSYSEQTSLILLDIVESFSDSAEKDELLSVLEMANIREEADIDSDSMIDFSDAASSEQSTFFYQ